MCIITSRRSLTMLILLLTTCTALASCESSVHQQSRAIRSTSGKPTIIERPRSQNVHVNQSAKFVCRVMSTLPVTITWRKHEQELSNRPGSILLSNDSLILLYVQKSDDGIYKCIASNNAGRSSSQATLTVLDALIAPVITQVTPNKTIVEGERVTFTCKASGNPQPKIYWRISSPSADRQPERPSPSSIRILTATPRDSGEYSCIAVNKQGNDTRVVYLNVLGFPVFIKSPPLNITLHENATLNLDCQVIGSPTPDVRWYHGNKQIAQDTRSVILKNKTLVISRINFNDRGTYTCVANNSAERRRSKSTLLQVLSRPKLSCCPGNIDIVRNQTAIDGERISLNCSAVGYPELKFAWRFNNITISQQSDLFTISRVSKDKEGVYSCRVHNNLGSLLVKIFLSVLIPPKVTVIPERKLVLPGASVEFICIVTGDPIPKLTWYSSKGKVASKSSLVILNVTENDQGEYSCEGQSHVGRSDAKGTLVVAVQPTFVVVPLRNITANETYSIIVGCSAKGPDTPIINWYRLTKEGKKINISGNENNTLDSDTLKISQLVRDDGGFYLCEAKNLAGVINTTFFINIQYQPRLTLSGQHVSVKTGENASLYCPVDANPAAQIRWIYPVRFSGSPIEISMAKISDGGKYTCTAVNLLGTLQASVEVTVLTFPRIVGLKRVEKLNGWISLTCETEGNPQPTVRWLDQTPLLSGPYSVYLGNLQLGKTFIDTMKFVCNASNTYGWTTKYVKIPSSPSQLNIVETSSTSVTFSWMANSSEIIAEFVVERLSKTHPNWITVNSSVAFSVFTDHDLQPFSWFLFRVHGKNVLGTSDPSETLNITTREGVPSRPASIIVTLRELTSITVEWRPPKEPRGLFTNILYEVSCMERGSLLDGKISLNISYPFKIINLKSSTWYVIKIRAGRPQSNYSAAVYWSDYTSVETNTHQKAPVIPPEIKKVSSNGPRRIFVSWKQPDEYVEGYELLYKKYESSDNATTLIIKSWVTTSHMITGLTANQYYEIQLRMFTSGGYGPWSLQTVIHTDQEVLKQRSTGNMICRKMADGWHQMQIADDTIDTDDHSVSLNSEKVIWLPGPYHFVFGPDKLALPGPLSNSDGLPWKIALGGSLLALIILIFLLVYVHFARKSKRNGSDKKDGIETRKNHGYDFDNGSRVSDESEGSIEGIYNVNMEEGIDITMFDNSHHDATETDLTRFNLYIENPILPPDEMGSDNNYEAVRLATFTARPSPFATPGDSRRRTNKNLSSNELSSLDPDVVEPPVYAKVDFAAKARSRNRFADTSEQITNEMLI